MTLPLDISFQDLPHSKAIEEAVIKQADSLGSVRAEIARCRVSLIQAQRHPVQGRSVSVHIDVTTHRHHHVSIQRSSDDAYAALRDAFSEVKLALTGTGVAQAIEQADRNPGGGDVRDRQCRAGVGGRSHKAEKR